MPKEAETVKKLREASGAGVMDCKKALLESGGDFDKAFTLIRERGLTKVGKRAERETAAGFIQSYVHNGRIGALVDLRAETDFVVRSEPFQKLVKELAMQIAAVPAESVDELLKQPCIRDESRTVEDLVNDTIAKVGENIRINTFSRLEL